MTKTGTVTFLTLLILIVGGCRKELGVYLLNEMKNENPYTGYETLTYLSSNADTIILRGNGRFTEEFHSDHDGTADDKYYVNELDKCSFTEENENYELIIQLASRTLNTHQGAQSKILTSYLLDISFNDISASVSNSCRSLTSNVKLPISSFANSNNSYDSLLINGKYYHDVVVLSTDYYSDDCSENMQTDSIYYCTSHGIIKMVFLNNEVWELESIELD